MITVDLKGIIDEEECVIKINKVYEGEDREEEELDGDFSDPVKFRIFTEDKEHFVTIDLTELSKVVSFLEKI